MKIVNHLLHGKDGKQVSFQPTPNKGGSYTPQFLVMHYTAATKAKGSISWFLNSAANASAHLIIDRDGTITQFAPFNIVTWHAGKSQWKGLNGLNQHSIGIELVNGGKLKKTENIWTCPGDKKVIPDAEVTLARHKNESIKTGWHKYTDIQIKTALEVAALLVKTYKLKDVIGHEDIAPERKTDPGPAFPMSTFRLKAMSGKTEEQEKYITTTIVNIRVGPSTQFSPLTDPLPASTPVEILKQEGNWSLVEVLQTVNGTKDLEGWIFSKYLQKV